MYSACSVSTLLAAFVKPSVKRKKTWRSNFELAQVWSVYPCRISSTCTLTTVSQYAPSMSGAKLVQRRKVGVTAKRIW